MQFSEPAGLSIAGDFLYVADTNNHRVLKVNLDTKQTSVVDFAGLTPPAAEGEPSVAADSANSTVGKVASAERQVVRPGKAVTVTVELALPESYKLNAAFPAAATVTAEGGGQSVIDLQATGKRIRTRAGDGTVSFSLPLTGDAGETSVGIALQYGYCREGKGGLCKVQTARWVLPLRVSEEGSETIRLSAPPAEPPRND